VLTLNLTCVDYGFSLYTFKGADTPAVEGSDVEPADVAPISCDFFLFHRRNICGNKCCGRRRARVHVNWASWAVSAPTQPSLAGPPSFRRRTWCVRVCGLSSSGGFPGIPQRSSSSRPEWVMYPGAKRDDCKDDNVFYSAAAAAAAAAATIPTHVH